MISVDISNIWCRVSLPELLEAEKEVFDAHLALGGGECKQSPWFSWLSTSDDARRKWVGPVITAAEKIRRDSQILVVVGGGLPAAAARAAIRLLPARPGTLRLLFVGEDYSAEKWQKVVQALDGADFSVLVLSTGKSDTASMVALRSLRWILRSRCGEDAPQRIYVAANPATAMGRLAEKLGCCTVAVPQEPYAAASALSPAALLIMAAAGLAPGPIYSGAAAFSEENDIRSFDNPLWLYAAARKLLAAKGCTCETLCTTAPAAGSLGAWWQKQVSAAGSKGIFVRHASLPEDFLQMGGSLLQEGQFATVLRMGAMSRHVGIEADFRNLDGLGDLSQTDLDTVQAAAVDAVTDAFTENDVPYVAVECEQPPTEEAMGHLLLFVEMASILSARLLGDDGAQKQTADEVLKQLERRIKQN